MLCLQTEDRLLPVSVHILRALGIICRLPAGKLRIMPIRMADIHASNMETGLLLRWYRKMDLSGCMSVMKNSARMINSEVAEVYVNELS